MKTNILAIAALAALIVPMTSVADDGNFYIKGSGGVGMPMDSDVDNMPGTIGAAEMSFDNGFAASFAAGYNFANPLRIEIESLHQKSDLDSLSYNGLDTDFNGGHLTSHSLMLNGYYDIDTGSAWTPFAGVGLGGSKIKLGDLGLKNDDSDGVLTYQFIGGISYAFNEDLSVDAQYRYIGTGDTTVESTEFEYGSNNLMLGIRYDF